MASEATLYLDSSALVKLVIDESHTPALLDAVSDHKLLSSEIAITEVPRAVGRALVSRHGKPAQAARRASASSPPRGGRAFSSAALMSCEERAPQPPPNLGCR